MTVELNPFEINVAADSPIVGAAVHDGHLLRSDVIQSISLDDSQRRREEDPHTGVWAKCVPSWIVGRRSRFEVDLNRPRDKAVYRTADDAWGLTVWKNSPPDSLVDASLEIYDGFYFAVQKMLTQLLRKHDHVVVLDIHSYNHRRGGPAAAPDDPHSNPEINVGTGTMDREFWSAVVDRLVGDLRGFDFDGRHLDVRENVKFRGGHFGGWIHRNFPNRVCVPAIEFKKYFMDECTGEPYHDQIQMMGELIQSTIPGILGALKQMAVKAR